MEWGRPWCGAFVGEGFYLIGPGFRVVLAQVTRFIARDVAEDHTKAVRGKGGCPSFHSHEGEEKEEEEEAKHVFFFFFFVLSREGRVRKGGVESGRLDELL